MPFECGEKGLIFNEALSFLNESHFLPAFWLQPLLWSQNISCFKNYLKIVFVYGKWLIPLFYFANPILLALWRRSYNFLFCLFVTLLLHRRGKKKKECNYFVLVIKTTTTTKKSLCGRDINYQLIWTVRAFDLPWLLLLWVCSQTASPLQQGRGQEHYLGGNQLMGDFSPTQRCK